MIQDFLPDHRPDLSSAALAVIDLFNQRSLPHNEAASVALATFAEIATAFPCGLPGSVKAAEGITSLLRFRAGKVEAIESGDSDRIAAEAERSARHVPAADQRLLAETVREVHEYLIAKRMPQWLYFDTLVSLYVSAIEAHPDQAQAAHKFGAALQRMFPQQLNNTPAAAASHFTH